MRNWEVVLRLADGRVKVVWFAGFLKSALADAVGKYAPGAVVLNAEAVG